MIAEYQSYLEHSGVKGQKWGVRRYQNPDGTLTEEGKVHYGISSERDRRKIDKEAQRDAKRYAEAKAYYGEGAGNRRKIVKNELSKKMSNPYYKDRFEEFVKNADMVKAQKKAVRERNARDTAKSAKRTARKASVFMLSNGPTLLRVAQAFVG